MGLLLKVCGAVVLLWVVLQVGLTISVAAYHIDADWRPRGIPPFFPLLLLPSREGFDNAMFLFNLTLGSLLWLLESGLAIFLLLIGRRITMEERSRRREEKEAIDRLIEANRSLDQRRPSAPSSQA